MVPAVPGGAPDSLRAVLDTVFRAPEYEWVQRPNAFAPLWAKVLEFLEWLRGLEQAAPALYWLILWVLASILVVIVVHAGWVVARTLGAARAPAAADQAGPAAEVHGVAWYRREAQRLAQQGRYVEAVQADFAGLLLELDQSGTLRFHPSKTPYEYIAELKAGPPVRAEFGALVRALYGYAFARRPCGPEEYASWRAQSDRGRYAASH